MKQKRYQYISSKGEKKFTPWFDYDGEEEPWQLKAYNLKNEYREI